MFIGHFAAALAAKRLAPRVSLGTLTLAAAFPDLLIFPLLIFGVEHAAIQPGITVVNALNLYDYPISHSLVMDAVWGALLAAIYYLRRRSPRAAWVIVALVVSHWVLDFLSHRPDMPLAPGVYRYFGLGLWNSPAATFLVEGLLWAAGLVLYVRATHPLRRAGIYGVWTMVAALTLLWLTSLRGTPPPNMPAVIVVNLALLAAVLGWAYWIDRIRVPSGRAAAARIP
jgi:membrane-bound metal-dependent hydrolase YbcI (DUF457 family)